MKKFLLPLIFTCALSAVSVCGCNSLTNNNSQRDEYETKNVEQDEATDDVTENDPDFKIESSVDEKPEHHSHHRHHFKHFPKKPHKPDHKHIPDQEEPNN
jgi:hypothetical protein